MLLLDDLQGLSNRWMLVCTLKVPDEHGTQLVPGVDGSLGLINKPLSGHAGQYHGQIVSLYPIVSSYDLNNYVVDLDELFGVA
jgi:hypothetical protein